LSTLKWTDLLDGDGVVLRYVEDVRDGLPLADLARVAPGRNVDEAARTVLARNPGWLIATEDSAFAENLRAVGAEQIRHAFVMSAETSVHRDAAVVETVPRASIDAREFLAGWLAAYPAGHPDHEEGTDEDILARCWDWYDEPVWREREHRSSGLVVRDGQVIAGIIVSIRPQPAPFGGPWVHDIWRVPGASEPGTGSALIAQAMRLLDVDGQPVLGLTVSDGNPARRVYERLGFQPVLESWTLRLPTHD
jgi:ribosomal protein S18 acetylase RimI-like enzyme